MSEAKIAKKAQALDYARKAGNLGPSVVDAIAAAERKRLEAYLAKRERSD